jgi:asparagine N-glycosylation enzyme membrane subunit Stt3
MNEKQLFEERKKKVFSFLKEKIDWISYLFLAIIVFMGVRIRVLNVPGLKNIATGGWSLGPDLDPFLFLRWAEYILEHGTLMAIDSMRYFPLGFNTAAEMKLLSYLIVWFHSFFSFFSGEASLTYSAIIFPAFMFGLATIGFFLFTREIFRKDNALFRNIVSLVATTFFVLTPSLLSRTIAGIPEKEAAAYPFIFFSLFFLLKAFNSERINKSLIYSLLSGILGGLLALIWGGFIYIFMAIAGAFLFSFILNKMKKREFLILLVFTLGAFLLMIPFSERYDLKSLLTSVSTGFLIIALGIFLLDVFLRKNKYFKIDKKIRLPPRFLSILIALVLGLLFVMLFLGGFGFVWEQASDIIGQTVYPLGNDRLSLTIAENKQPSFVGEWKQSFGPLFFEIPLYFWMFFIGAIALFGKLIKTLRKKERVLLLLGYSLFLVCLIFSRYSSGGTLNGSNFISLLLYFGGTLSFLWAFYYFYSKRFENNEMESFTKFDFGIILYFVLFTLAIVGARGGVRLIMVLAGFAPISAAYLISFCFQKSLTDKGEGSKMFFVVATIIVLLAGLFTLYVYHTSMENNSRGFVPGPYQWQWQKAMAWVDENVQPDAVFAHWWDYGYWVQTLGKRATILDGGNSLGYWNHLMGRNVLTGKSEAEALDFLYSHNGTHLLIDSTEIGKYTAYSSIGSDSEYDRFSWITTFFLDEKQTIERENSSLHVYSGTFYLDEDLIWETEGKKILLPKRAAAVAGIVLEVSNEGFEQPEAVVIYNNQQYRIPMKYLYLGKQKVEFEKGIDSGIFLFSSIASGNGNQVSINEIGAALYLSNRTRTGNMVKWYLFGEESDYVNLVHKEQSYIVELLEEQGRPVGDFVYYGQFQGPIKIWEIAYPEGMEKKEIYLRTDYPTEEIFLAKKGEY